MEQAVFLDCLDLIEKFAGDGKPYFDSFCNQWKLMKFQHIYSAQTTNIEMLQTTATALHVAKRTICGHEEMNIAEAKRLLYRIGGVYLMYGIYFKQPTGKFVKVDVSLETWKQIKAFIDTLPPTAEMDDVRYVFWVLLKENAFRFTALDFQVALEQFVDYDMIQKDLEEEQTEVEKFNSKLRKQLHEYTETEALLPPLNTLEDGYNEMKELLYKKDNMNSQTLPPTTIFQQITKTFQNIEKILSTNDTNGQELRDESKRRSLKRKGYEVSTTGNNDETDVEGSNSQIRSARRMSARTIFAEELPENVLKDLQD